MRERAFRGDVELKPLIQHLHVSVAEKVSLQALKTHAKTVHSE